MKAAYRILGSRRRNVISDFACEAWCQSHDDRKASRVAEDRIRREMRGIVGTILVGVAIKLAVDLIAHWLKSAIIEPGFSFSAGEPGAET